MKITKEVIGKVMAGVLMFSLMCMMTSPILIFLGWSWFLGTIGGILFLGAYIATMLRLMG